MTGPKLVAWELTRRCNLCCMHCRASAGLRRDVSELSLDEAKAVVDDIASFARPILILTGGEPLLCPYLFELIAYAREKGLRPVIGTNATLIDDALAARIAAAGVKRVSVSIDFPDAAEHDRFRGVSGSFDAAVRGIRALQRAGVEVQINSTVTRLNRTQLPRLHDLAVELGAKAFHPFLLVPTGRGADLADAELSACEYEDALSWICRRSADSPLELKPTDAPQYQRIVCQMNGRSGERASCPFTKGCLAGTGFAFIGQCGDVQPCGYFDLKLGNVREKPFSRIWAESPVLDDLRHPERLKGKCGICEYKAVCGGCRARALARTEDYLAEEPSCVHVPDRELLDRLQTDFPLVEHPYAVLGKEFGLSEVECYERVKRLSGIGLIRRIGASFDSRKLGYVSTLIAAQVAPERLDDVAAKVSEFPEVTHNYARFGEFNLWFTVVAGNYDRIDSILIKTQNFDGVQSVLDLPVVQTYKLAAIFPSKPGSVPSLVGSVPSLVGSVPCLDTSKPGSVPCLDKNLVRKFQGDVLGFGLTPFGTDEVDRLKAMVADGVVRRFGAIVNHRRVGFVVNALTAWTVDGARRDALGAAFARMDFVSHCYVRRSADGWPYSVYAMVHARSRDELRNRLAELTSVAAEVTGASPEPLVMKTMREYVKRSMRYFEAGG